MTTWAVPYFDLQLGDLEREAVTDVLDDGWLSMGPRLERFERAFVEALTTPELEAVAVANCTVALHLALVALGVKPGDEVICPSLTFVADANAIVQCGAEPVFADVIGEDDWTLDPADVAAKITPRTKAVIAVHYAGYPCRMEALLSLCRKNDVRLVEDAAHAPLGEADGALAGRKLGTLGDVGCFSFFSNKNMTTGEGGMVVTTNRRVAAVARAMRSHGMTSSSYQRFRGHAFAYDVVTPGFNYRMDEMRAALGLVQLAKLPAATEARRRLVEAYREALRALPEVSVPFSERTGRFAYHVFPILLPLDVDRRQVMARMAEAGVQTSIHYRPIHSFRAYARRAVEVPVTDAIAPRILSLPLFPTLQDTQLEYVVDVLAEALSDARSRAA